MYVGYVFFFKSDRARPLKDPKRRKTRGKVLISAGNGWQDLADGTTFTVGMRCVDKKNR